MSESTSSAGVAVATNPEAGVAAPMQARGRGPSLLHLGVVVGILGGGVVLTALTSDVTAISDPGIRVFPDTVVDDKGRTITVERPALPEVAGPWVGGELTGLSQAEQDILPKDTQGARRLYTHPDGRQIYCSIVLAGRDVTSIHRPEMCLPGQGWSIKSQYVEPVAIAGRVDGQLEVMRMNTLRQIPLGDGQTAQAHSLFAYWFVGKDRVTPHHWQRILWTTRDRVLHNKNHRWAYILIHAPVAVAPNAPATELAAAETESMEIVKGFIQSVYPELAAN